MSDGRVRTTLRVRYSEVDPQGIVFNSRYLEYVDVGLTELMRARGINVIEMAARDHFDTAVVKATVEYRAPAHVDEEIEVVAWVERIGTTSFTVAFEIYRQGTAGLLARAEMVYANYSVARRTAVPIPDDVRAALEATS